MDERDSLDMYLPMVQDILIYGLNFLYLLGFYIFMHVCIGGRMSVIHGVMYLVGLYVLCIFKRKYFTNTILIISGFLIALTINTCFLYVFSGFFSATMICSLWVLFEFVFADLRDCSMHVYRCIYIMHWYYLALPIVTYIYGAYKSQQAFKIASLLLLMCFVLVHFLCDYFKGFEKYYKTNRNIEGAPGIATFRSNSKMSLYFIGGMFLVMLLSALFSYDEIFVYIAKLVFKFFEMLIWLFGKFMAWLESLHLLPGGTASNVNSHTIMNGINRSKWFWLWQLICNLLFFYIVFVIIRNIIKGFDKKLTKQTVVSEDIKMPAKDTHDKVEDLKVEKREEKHFFRNAKERVRHIFYKKMKRKYKNDVPISMTSHELAGEQDKNLAALYDIARYSEHEIDSKGIKKL